ncbi:hypothetical protein ACYVU7_11495 [Arenicellales bacterium IMCC56312]
MILIWSAVVLLAILGAWWWMKVAKRSSKLVELRAGLKQSFTSSNGESWTNVATFEIWQSLDNDWSQNDLPDLIFQDEDDEPFSGGEPFFDLSAEYLRSSKLNDHIQPFNGRDREAHGVWSLGSGWDDLQIYLDLLDYDQLSERLQASWKKHYSDKKYHTQ